MNATVAQLTARSLLGRRRTILLLLLPVIVLLLSLAARLAAGPDTRLAVVLLSTFALGTVVPLIGLIVGTGAIGPEIDDGSIVYLLSKPLDRRTIATTKFAVAAALVVAVAAVPTLIAGLILVGTDDRLAAGFAAGAAVAGIGYCALFLLLAVVTRNAVVIGVVYALVWESAIGGFVPGAQALSIQQWSLAVTERVLGDGAAALDVSSAVSFTTGLVWLVVVIVGGTWLAGQRLRSLRVTSDE